MNTKGTADKFGYVRVFDTKTGDSAPRDTALGVETDACTAVLCTY